MSDIPILASFIFRTSHIYKWCTCLLEFPVLQDILVSIFFLPASAIGYFILYVLGFHKEMGLKHKNILFFSICFLCGASVTIILSFLLYHFQETIVIRDFLSLFNITYLAEEMKIFPYILPAQILIFFSTPLWLLVVWFVMRRREKMTQKKLSSVDIPRAKESLQTINRKIREIDEKIGTLRERILGTKYLFEALPKSISKDKIEAITKVTLDNLEDLSSELTRDDSKEVVMQIKSSLNDLLTSLKVIRNNEKGEKQE